MAERNPCPNCGCRETIESLQDELRAVRKRAAELLQPTMDRLGGRVLIYHGPGIGPVWAEPEPTLRFVYEVCTNCGLTYYPDVKSRASELRAQIEQAMKLIPLDVMADTIKDSDSGLDGPA